jgi:hypothetical protein
VGLGVQHRGHAHLDAAEVQRIAHVLDAAGVFAVEPLEDGVLEREQSILHRQFHPLRINRACIT